MVRPVLVGAVGPRGDGRENAAETSGFETQRAVAGRRPNVLLVVTDDQKQGTVTRRIMPHTHRALVRNGFRFTNGFVTNSWCCPSRASILTGQYSHNNGVWTVGGKFGMKAWFAHEDSTLATWLHRAGYRTGIVGKYFNEYGTPNIRAYRPRGWDRTAIMTNLIYSLNPGYFNYRLFEGGGLVRYGGRASDYSTRVFTRKARRFIAPRRGGTPWFLYLAYTSPHGPPIHDPKDGNAARGISFRRPANLCERDVSDKPRFVRRQPPCSYTREQYNKRMRGQQARMLKSVDRGLGQIYADLRATGQMRNTLILYISDNGSLMGSHRVRGKELPYEESVRVPLLMRWDALRRAPRPIRAFALNIDLAPTITGAARVRRHNRYDGKSLIPLVKRPSATGRRAFLLEHLTTGRNDPGGPSYCAVRTRRFKYVQYSTGERELYDMVNDPGELTSRHRAPALRPTMRRLRHRMLELCRPSPPGWNPR